MTAATLHDLAARMTAPLQTSAGHSFLEIVPPMLAILARGKPVAPAEIAAAAGRSSADVRAALDRLPSIEWDEQGRIVGAGLSLRPTPHRFEVDGRELYTWCALDALLFATLLDRPARIVSPCHATGEPVTITVTPGGVTAVDPPSAVLSVIEPQNLASLRSVACENGHFFRSAAVAADWHAKHPAATILSIMDGFRLGRLIAAAVVSPAAAEVDG